MPVPVAVIVPYYNGHKYIDRALKSILSQTRPADEIIVVNDGSSAESTAELARICADRAITVLHKENGGQGSARNFGVAKARSRFICFLDQDDFFLPGHIATLTAATTMDRDDFGWSYSDLLGADENGEPHTPHIARKLNSQHPKTSLAQMVSRDMYVLPGAALISREAFLKAGGFDTSLRGYEDDDMFIRIFLAGYTNEFIPEDTTVWCINSESTSYSVWMSRSRLNFVRKMMDLLPRSRQWQGALARDFIYPRFTRAFFGGAARARNRYNDAPTPEGRARAEEEAAICEDYFRLVMDSGELTPAQRGAIFAFRSALRSDAALRLVDMVDHVRQRKGASASGAPAPLTRRTATQQSIS